MRCIPVLLTVAILLPGRGAAAQSDAGSWVEYRVRGPVTLTGREDDVMMCSSTSETFLARSLGSWVIDIEAEGSGEGEFPAAFYVAAPREFDDRLRDDDPRTDDRFRGEGTVTITSTGARVMGFDVVEVAFTAERLESGGGIGLSVQGTLSCPVM